MNLFLAGFTALEPLCSAHAGQHGDMRSGPISLNKRSTNRVMKSNILTSQRSWGVSKSGLFILFQIKNFMNINTVGSYFFRILPSDYWKAFKICEIWDFKVNFREEKCIKSFWDWFSFKNIQIFDWNNFSR